MLAEVITIGDEILIGQIVDTNSAWIGNQLHLSGIQLSQISSVSDTREAILEALELAEGRADLILITGGLGPTKDDITKPTLAEFFNTTLVRHQPTLDQIEEMWRKRGWVMPGVNLKQADLPESATVLTNPIGTAPGMWFEKDGKVFVSMPGVPYEMKDLMTNHVLPRVKEHFHTPDLYHRTVLTQGIGESSLMEIIGDWETSLEAEQIKLAYLPSLGSVRLRLSGAGEDHHEVMTRVGRKISELEELIPKYIFGYDTDTLELVVGQLLRENDFTLATAESCTGGYIGHLITSVPGSSDYYQGSIVSYANIIKEKQLGVPAEMIREHGAVSEEVVIRMAEGARELMDVDFVLSTSGIAGPGGGSEAKPVGTIWVAISGPTRTRAKVFKFGNHRERNIRRTAITGLSMLRKEILKHLSENS